MCRFAAHHGSDTRSAAGTRGGACQRWGTYGRPRAWRRRWRWWFRRRLKRDADGVIFEHWLASVVGRIWKITCVKMKKMMMIPTEIEARCRRSHTRTLTSVVSCQRIKQCHLRDVCMCVCACMYVCMRIKQCHLRDGCRRIWTYLKMSLLEDEPMEIIICTAAALKSQPCPGWNWVLLFCWKMWHFRTEEWNCNICLFERNLKVSLCQSLWYIPVMSMSLINAIRASATVRVSGDYLNQPAQVEPGITVGSTGCPDPHAHAHAHANFIPPTRNHCHIWQHSQTMSL